MDEDDRPIGGLSFVSSLWCAIWSHGRHTQDDEPRRPSGPDNCGRREGLDGPAWSSSIETCLVRAFEAVSVLMHASWIKTAALWLGVP
jgi:hypothetical protein